MESTRARAALTVIKGLLILANTSLLSSWMEAAGARGAQESLVLVSPW